jgi:hypothetical protein
LGPFRPFQEKFCQNSATDLYGHSVPFVLCSRRISLLGTLPIGGTAAGTACKFQYSSSFPLPPLPPLSPLTSLRGINISAGKGICEKGNSAGIRLAWGVGGGGEGYLNYCMYVYCILHRFLFPFLSSYLQERKYGKVNQCRNPQKICTKKILLQ